MVTKGNSHYESGSAEKKFRSINVPVYQGGAETSDFILHFKLIPAPGILITA